MDEGMDGLMMKMMLRSDDGWTMKSNNKATEKVNGPLVAPADKQT